jgi:hypothetical protein
MRMADLADVTCYTMGTPGADGVTSSDLDGSTCVWTQILRRVQIQRGKLKIFTVAPNMDKLVTSMLDDLLRFGWFNLHLNLNFEESPDLKRKF